MEGEKKSSKAHASGKKESASTDKVLQSQAYQKAVDRHYGILEDLPHYRDFSNPLAMFLDAAVHGARTTNRSSLEHASASLGTLKGMLEDSSFDPFIKELDQRFNGKTATPWVHMVIERGLAPRKISQSLDIPILINGHITGIHLAFPALSPQPLDGNKTKILKMEQPLEATILCDIDAIQMRELKTQLRATIWAQVASAGFKTFLEVQLAEQDPSLGILGYLINSSLNIADTRSWNALPKHIEVISVPYQDSSIKLNIGHQNLEIKGLSSQFDQLVHIKSLDGPLHYQITDLKDPYLASTRLDSTN
jgi:hypothetical protein